MATSTQKPLFLKLTYNDKITEQISKSGGTIVFTKDNIIVASEISEAQYRNLLINPYVQKIDVLPLKRYANEGIKYIENENLSDAIVNTTTLKASSITSVNTNSQSTGGGGSITPSGGG
jgi:hypothetical protein